MLHRIDMLFVLMAAEYPETERLSEAFRTHKKESGLSFSEYATKTMISRRTLLDFSTNKVRLLYETGKKLELWMLQNPSLDTLDIGYLNPYTQEESSL